MYINRNLVAKLLETKPNKIESLKQFKSKIYIKLNGFEDELFITVLEYQNCLRQLKGDRKHIDNTGFVTIMAIIGTLVFATVSSINSNLANNDNSQVGIELTAEYQTSGIND